MKTNSNSRINFSQFEPVKEIEKNRLIGGFSISLYTKDIDNSIGGGSNNCDGGNCSSGCGSGQNISCNTTSGCHNDNGTNIRC